MIDIRPERRRELRLLIEIGRCRTLVGRRLHTELGSVLWMLTIPDLVELGVIARAELVQDPVQPAVFVLLRLRESFVADVWDRKEFANVDAGHLLSVASDQTR